MRGKVGLIELKCTVQGKQVTATKRDLTSVIKHMIICCKFVAGN